MIAPTYNKTNYNLEILRGFAAVIVIFSHIIFHNKYFDANYFPICLKTFDPPAHFAVLLFFVLSGYVIGINHKEKLTGQNIAGYLKRRLIRVYPIYILGIILGLSVAAKSYPFNVLAANFTLTQNIVYPVIWENNPAWSLNYEVLYYLLFIPISYFNVKPLIAILVCLMLGVLNMYTVANPLLSAYTFGYCFWLAGLYLSQSFKNGSYKIKLLPALFYILAIPNIIGDTYIARLLSIIKQPKPIVAHFWAQNIIDVTDLIFLPYCFIIVLFFAGKDLANRKLVFFVLQLLPAFIIYQQFKHHTHDVKVLYLSIVYMALAGLTYFINIPDQFIRTTGIKLGSISYGLYIIHFPILFLFGRVYWLSNGLPAYAIRLILYLGLTFTTAWLLERKLQPEIKKWFIRG